MGRKGTGRPADIPIGLHAPRQDFERRARVVPPGSVTYIYSGEFRTTEKEADVTLANQMVVLVDARAGDITVNLPAASGKVNKVYYIKKIDTTHHTVTIKPYSGDEIDTDSEYKITVPMTCIVVICDGSNWWII